MRKTLLALLLLVALAACGDPPKPLTPELKELLALINEVRATETICKKGGEHRMPAVAPLSENAQLNRAAQWHAEDMAAADRLSHDTPPGAVHFRPGTSPGERITQAGYLYTAMGENIAYGYTTPQAVLQAWLDSTEGHCEGLMDGRFVHAGLGRSGDYWVLDMAAPQ